MHPILHHWPRLRLFLLVWLPVGAALAGGPFLWAGGSPGDLLPVVLWGETFATPVLASWYLVRFTPPGAGLGTLAWRIGGGATVTAVLWAVAGRAWLDLWRALTSMPVVAPRAFLPLSAAIAAVLFIAMGAVHYALVVQDSRQEVLRRALDAEVGAREAELRALRAQINPHFLFNCLHSIGALAGSDPEQARRMCQELADFFRDSLRAGSERLVPLATDVALAERYLAIERIRFGDRLRPTIHLAPDAGAVRVPPLLLQPLVENAVRHGIASLVEGGEVTLDLVLAGPELRITMENPFDPDARRAGTGIGLTNVRARLAGLYGDRALLTAGPTGDRFRVEVRLPVDRS